MLKRSNWCLIGIPDHQGVYNVGGRLGAAHGPHSFRSMLFSLKGKSPIWTSMQDAGNLKAITKDIAHNHQQAANLIQEQHLKTGLSVIVGGGHDHGYSQLLGISKIDHSIGCINIDAHLDVRKPNPLPGSGSPFYLAIEAGLLHQKNFIEFGIQDHCNAAELWTYVENKKIEVIPMKSLRQGQAVEKFKSSLKKLSAVCNQIVVSLDLDAVASAFAPGVSAPQAEGLTPSEIFEMMEISGQNKKVSSLGIFELNPLHDIEKITSRLAATAAYHFLEEALKS